jgi:hypothetical protein
MSYTGIQDAVIGWDSEVSSPFSKLTRRVYPRTIRETFAWGEELWMHHGMYSQSISTAVRYFMTEIDIDGDDIDFQSRKNYIDQIRKVFDILEELAVIGDDYMAFGNSFTTSYRPFQRTLTCRKCGFRSPLKQMHAFYSFSNDGVFKGQCPTCSYQGAFIREDTLLPKEKMKPKVTRWPPQYMMIKYHPLSQRKIIAVDLPRYTALSDGIRNGDTLFLEDTPWEIVQAALKNQQFEFAEGEIFHMASPVAACCLPNLKGWGLPPFMADFETAVLVTMLDKYVETILVEYLMPFRVLSPSQSGGQQDIMMNVNMSDFSASVMDMLRRHRKNPTDWNMLPYPLDYQVMGGEAGNLVPVEILEHFEMRLLHSMGIPPEFYKSSIQGFSSTAGPVIGFKMFERTWQHFANELNKWATWQINILGDLMSWENVTASLKPVSMYEDPEIRAVKLELSAAGRISDDTAFRAVGLDSEAERRKRMDEEEQGMLDSEERQRRMDERAANTEAARVPGPGEQMLMAQQAQQEQAAGGAPPGGAPPGGASMPPMGGGMSVGGSASLDDLLTQADQIAQQLLVADSTARQSQLRQLKNQNEALHAQVKARLTDLEQQGQAHGIQLARSGQLPPA